MFQSITVTEKLDFPNWIFELVYTIFSGTINGWLPFPYWDMRLLFFRLKKVQDRLTMIFLLGDDHSIDFLVFYCTRSAICIAVRILFGIFACYTLFTFHKRQNND